MSIERRSTRRSTTENVTVVSSTTDPEDVISSKKLTEVNANLTVNPKELLIDGLGVENGSIVVEGNGIKDENGCGDDEEESVIEDNDEEDDDGTPDAKIAKLSDDTDEQSNLSGDQVVSSKPKGRKEKVKHQCHLCEKSFLKKGFLTKHLKSHSQPRPFICDTEGCDKTFVSTRGLEKHVKTVHEGEEFMLHLCAFCQKGFITRSEMESHAETHVSDYKMYACRYCGKTFVKKFAMKIAVQACQDQPVDPCPYCNKGINPNAYKDN